MEIDPCKYYHITGSYHNQLLRTMPALFSSCRFSSVVYTNHIKGFHGGNPWWRFSVLLREQWWALFTCSTPMGPFLVDGNGLVSIWGDSGHPPIHRHPPLAGHDLVYGGKKHEEEHIIAWKQHSPRGILTLWCALALNMISEWMRNPVKAEKLHGVNNALYLPRSFQSLTVRKRALRLSPQ